MSEALIAGFLLGIPSFAGLWWTVGKGLLAEHPGLFSLASLWLRMGLLLLGFHLASGGDWRRLLMCLVGFQIGRACLTRGVRNAP